MRAVFAVLLLVAATGVDAQELGHKRTQDPCQRVLWSVAGVQAVDAVRSKLSRPVTAETVTAGDKNPGGESTCGAGKTACAITVEEISAQLRTVDAIDAWSKLLPTAEEKTAYACAIRRERLILSAMSRQLGAGVNTQKKRISTPP